MQTDICELITLPTEIDAAAFFNPIELLFGARVARPVISASPDGAEGAEKIILRHLQKLAEQTDVDIAAAEVANLRRVAGDMGQMYTFVLKNENVYMKDNPEFVKEAAEYIERSYRPNEDERKVLSGFLEGNKK